MINRSPGYLRSISLYIYIVNIMPAYDLPTPEIDHQQVEYWQTLYKQMHTLNARRYQHISTSKSIQLRPFIARFIIANILQSSILISLHNMLPFELTKDTPYLALSGELWSVFYEYFKRNWPCYKGFLLYSPSLSTRRGGMSLRYVSKLGHHRLR